MIKIGIPSKGRLRKDTLSIFKNKNLKILSERGERDLFGYIKVNKKIKIVYLHARDLTDKDFQVRSGDYFSYGQLFFEITSVIADKNVYGQVEHQTGYKVTGKQARQGQINVKPLGPTSEAIDDPDAVQKTFVQQRGQEENSLGKTGDVRALQQNEKLEAPVSKPQEVSNKGNSVTTDSSFYGDE